MGTVDGPGVRFVVFLQGCNLRCGCCHNPDTWNMAEGKECSADEIVAKAKRYKEYFGETGGITLSGGEPLLQPEFAGAVFELCHLEGINTCLDTSGSILNDSVLALLDVSDRVLLDIKYCSDELYKKHVGCSLDSVLEFLKLLEERKIPTTLRQVLIPTLNDSDESLRELKRIADAHSCVDKVEILPFKKICKVKYDEMGIKFPFEQIPTPDRSDVERAKRIIG